MLNREDIITALATPPGVGAISVVRVSGENCFAPVDRYFKGKVRLAEAKSHTIHYGNFVTAEGDTIDDVLVSVFRAPNSYTGEDSLEISSHGSPYIAGRIIETLNGDGIRMAEPGEFTKRAFLNGKLDLAQAEAVAEVINSRTEASLRGARSQLDGILSAKVNELRSSLLESSSLVELELDFAEEDLEFVPLTKLKGKIEAIMAEIDELIATYSFGKVIRDGVNTAFVGAPNVGKSSLLNYILKESRAIVSEIPGTTRDVIREDVSIDGILFRLYDTAGIRLTDDAIEKEGVLRSRSTVKEADLVVYLSDPDHKFGSGLDEELQDLTSKENIIRVMNKIDLDHSVESGADLNISAKTGEGIHQLFNIMKQRVFSSQSYTEKSAIVTSARHYTDLKKANEHLANAIESIDGQMSGEFISVDLRNAENALGEIIGEVTTDDILNNIFEKFCIGK